MIVFDFLEWAFRLWAAALWVLLACFGAFTGLTAWAIMLVAICIHIEKKFVWIAAILYAVTSISLVVFSIRMSVSTFDKWGG
ncbi:hypothetical protein [Herbaspirillum frisingense]|uniref:hypothetical protein n=1 Tax=Herbaspirillum frisingense TaxID=92645 RepID=UPI0039B0B6D4